MTARNNKKTKKNAIRRRRGLAKANRRRACTGTSTGTGTRTHHRGGRIGISGMMNRVLHQDPSAPKTESNSFFGHTVLPLDEFYNQNCLNSADPKASKIVMRDLNNRSELDIVAEMFGRGSKDDQALLFRCVRTFVMLELFIREDMAEYDKYRMELINMEDAVSRMDAVRVQFADSAPNARQAPTFFTRFTALMKTVAKITVMEWAKAHVHLEDPATAAIIRRTRLRAMVSSRSGAIRKVVTSLKPEYYYLLIYDRENQLSVATRKYIYDIMAESAVIDTPQKMGTTMFNMDLFNQINNLDDLHRIPGYEHIQNAYAPIR